MKLPALETDNITELLLKIIKFAKKRRQVLMENINNVLSPGFIPRDLAVDEFCTLLNNAINEHISNRRLVLYDTDSIKFGMAGSFAIEPIVDSHAHELLGESQGRYLELQINKLLENSLNYKVAKELLEQKQGMFPIFE